MWKRLLILTGLLVVGGCTFAAREAQPLHPVETTPNPTIDRRVWRSIKPGLEQKISTASHDDHQYTALIFRLDNKMSQWDLAYNKDPKRLSEWAENLDSDIIINGAFFTEEFIPTGLFTDESLVIAKVPYTDKTVGTVSFKDGHMSLGKNGEDVFQSFPFLIRPDKSEAIKEDSEKIARRTIIGQDATDHSYIIIFDATPLSLFDASTLLPQMLPELVWALNLDGGPSTGVIVRDDTNPVTLLPATALPIVLSVKMEAAVSPRGQ